MGHVSTDKNKILFEGDFGEADLQASLAILHKLANGQKLKEIELDFTKSTKAIAPEIVPLCAYVRSLSLDDVHIRFSPPEEKKLSRLFDNAGWSHLIDPTEFGASEYASKNHSPAIVYNNGEEQHKAVDGILEILLQSIRDVTRNQFAALEWSINEITDNVLNHSESLIGGIVQVTSRRSGTMVEFVVCDAGLGIPRTLRSSHREIGSDTYALDRAIREGITRNSTTNMGNGLYGSYRIAQLSGGHFKIQSGYATLKYSPKIGMHIRQNKVPFNGTLISCSIDCSNPKLLEEALIFKGSPYKPSYTYFDKLDESENVKIIMSDETKAFGTRESSKPIRLKIENIIHNSGAYIEVDMSGVALVSSSFADEVFGKLFASLGATTFMQRIKISKTERIVSQLIDRAISQRMSLRM